MTNEHAFGPRTRRVLQAFFDRIFDPGEPSKVSPADIGLADVLSRSMADGPALNRLGFFAMAHGFNATPLVFIHKLSRFTRLDSADQDRMIEALAHHPLRPVRTAFFGLKMVASVHFWEHPVVLEDIGYGELELLPEQPGMEKAS